ncbi:MAG: bacillithiol biosynthesis cysteine-adding enzyme BshC [Flavobacteriaceae bacterium]|nr:bacillithiol biosynthesis cysteine-adding enzyme BshC [Flavobacteriaceae bacterium]
MKAHKTIPFQKTGYFSKIICDYLDRKENLSEFYDNYPDIKGFEKQIKNKRDSFSDSSRNVLVSSLDNQYQDLSISDKTKVNINLLKQNNTFTVATGHQLNLYTGPLYFLYKIVSAINLAKQLSKEFTDCNFVPVYWMATEDHDFEEIQYFNFKNIKINWNRESQGAVGRLTNKGLESVFQELSKLLGKSKSATFLKELFSDAYLQHDNLTDATRYLANELFGEYGLVIIDGDDKKLKQQFTPFVKEELLQNTSFKEVLKTIEKLEKNYKVQVNPREINLFYLDDNLRERIIFEEDIYKVNNTKIVFTKEEILIELNKYPEKFSPNVLLRPLYQEVILPNLCYIGGGGEIAYWFELKKYFEAVKVPFPILLLRNSVLLVTEKQSEKMQKLNISKEEIFNKQDVLIDSKVKSISEISIDFSSQRLYLENMFRDLEELSNKTDKSFLGAVKAQEKKQLKGIDNLEKRMLKAQKRKYNEIVSRIAVLQDELFPNQSLQERQTNFSEFYLRYGNDLIKCLIEDLDPLRLELDVIVL